MSATKRSQYINISKDTVVHRMVSLRQNVLPFNSKIISLFKNMTLKKIYVRLHLHVAVFTIRNKTSAMCKRIFTLRNQVGTFILEGVFTPGFARFVKLYRVNALTRKLQSHDRYWAGLRQVAETAVAFKLSQNFSVLSELCFQSYTYAFENLKNCRFQNRV